MSAAVPIFKYNNSPSRVVKKKKTASIKEQDSVKLQKTDKNS